MNNAGFGLLGRAIELDAAEQLAIVDLNMRALTALTLRFLPSIVAAKGGVLNVASVAAFMPGPGFAVYYATKAYVRSLQRSAVAGIEAAGGEGGLPVSRSGADRLPGAGRLRFLGRDGRDEAGDAAGGGSRASGLRGSDGRQARDRSRLDQPHVRLDLGGDAARAVAAAARVRPAAALINAGEICPATAKARLCWPPSVYLASLNNIDCRFQRVGWNSEKSLEWPIELHQQKDCPGHA